MHLVHIRNTFVGRKSRRGTSQQGAKELIQVRQQGLLIVRSIQEIDGHGGTATIGRITSSTRKETRQSTGVGIDTRHVQLGITHDRQIHHQHNQGQFVVRRVVGKDRLGILHTKCHIGGGGGDGCGIGGITASGVDRQGTRHILANTGIRANQDFWCQSGVGNDWWAASIEGCVQQIANRRHIFRCNSQRCCCITNLLNEVVVLSECNTHELVDFVHVVNTSIRWETCRRTSQETTKELIQMHQQRFLIVSSI